MGNAEPPFLSRVFQRSDRTPENPAEFPFGLPFVPDLNLHFTSHVTFFVGENGSGKSTMLEALAQLAGFPVGGGGKNETAVPFAPETDSPLSHYLRPAFRRRPTDGWRQLALLAHMSNLVRSDRAQFIVATHSPILMTYPGAQIVDFDDPRLPNTTLNQTNHFHITTGILSNPQRYWQHSWNTEQPSAILATLAGCRGNDCLDNAGLRVSVVTYIVPGLGG